MDTRAYLVADLRRNVAMLPDDLNEQSCVADESMAESALHDRERSS